MVKKSLFKKYTAAVLGCGKIGLLWEFLPKRPKPATHIGAFLKHSRIELLAAAEPNSEHRAVAQKFLKKIPVYQTAEELFQNHRPEIIALATPDELHLRGVELAVKNGVKLIICEKPIATNLVDGQRIIDLCEKSGVILLINHMRRFDKLLAQVVADLRGEKYGKIQQIRCLYPNGLLNNGTHAIDFIRWAVGEAEKVFGWKNNYPSFTHRGDYNVDGILEMQNGGRAVFQSVNKEDYSVFEIEFYGTKGAVLVRNLGFTIDILPVQKSFLFAGLSELNFEKTKRSTKYRSFFAGMADHAVACLDGKIKPISRGEDGLMDLRVLLALRRSAETGQSVKISEIS